MAKLFIFILALVIFPSILALKAKPTAKADKLRKKPQPLILTDSNYTDYTVDDYRSYGIYVLYTVRSKRFQCRYCAQAIEALNVVAGSHEKFFPNSTDIYFAHCVYEDNQYAFSMHQLETAPILSYFPPTKVKSGEELSKRLLPEYTINNEIDLKILLEHVEKLSGRKIPIYYTPESLSKISMLATIGFSILILYLSSLGRTWREIYESKGVWRIGALVVFGVSVSGMVYCIINKPALYHPNFEERNWKKKLTFFTDTSDYQTVGEGLIIGVMNVLGCIVLALSLKYSNSIHGAMIANCLNCLALSIFVVEYIYILIYLNSVRELYSLYCYKSGWYGDEISRYNRESWFHLKRLITWKKVKRYIFDFKKSWGKLTKEMRKLLK